MLDEGRRRTSAARKAADGPAVVRFDATDAREDPVGSRRDLRRLSSPRRTVPVLDHTREFRTTLFEHPSDRPAVPRIYACRAQEKSVRWSRRRDDGPWGLTRRGSVTGSGPHCGSGEENSDRSEPAGAQQPLTNPARTDGDRFERHRVRDPPFRVATATVTIGGRPAGLPLPIVEKVASRSVDRHRTCVSAELAFAVQASSDVEHRSPVAPHATVLS